MARKNANLSFAQACKYLELAPDKFAALREHGLVACITQEGRQIYPQISLELTRHLLALGQSRNWDMPTVAWYADLLFAAEIGRAILLPIDTIKTPTAAGLNNWTATLRNCQ